jgi:hypothetical protein
MSAQLPSSPVEQPNDSTHPRPQNGRGNGVIVCVLISVLIAGTLAYLSLTGGSDDKSSAAATTPPASAPSSFEPEQTTPPETGSTHPTTAKKAKLKTCSLKGSVNDIGSIGGIKDNDRIDGDNELNLRFNLNCRPSTSVHLRLLDASGQVFTTNNTDPAIKASTAFFSDQAIGGEHATTTVDLMVVVGDKLCTDLIGNHIGGALPFSAREIRKDQTACLFVDSVRVQSTRD